MRIVTSSLIALAVASTSLSAQSITVKEEKAGMLKLAKVTPSTATATALAKVPGGKVQSAEIEKEDGKLVYSFDIKVAGKSGIEEVLVDATSGAVVSVAHETPADEAKEAKADKAKEAKAKADKAKAAATVKKPGA
ncbi:PepSY domain-containing protein [Gemmatimonas sp.]|uniref:PepSY domain-containing protein n=1 Tax=Gemmatimonas sp. TaxID=1962908 RepID=UPI003983ABFF